MVLPEAAVKGFPRQPGSPCSLLSAPAVEGRHAPLPPGSHYPQAGQLDWLFVGPQESRHFGTQQFDKGPREHLLGFLGCVFEVVLWVRQHIEEGLDQLLVLQDMETTVGQGAGWDLVSA